MRTARITVYLVALASAVISVLHIWCPLLADRTLAHVAFWILAVALCVGAWRYGPRLMRHCGAALRRWASRLDLVAANVLLFVLLLEAGLWTVSRIAPTRLAYDPTSAESVIRVFRLKPHAEYFGFQFNKLGYYDEEFFIAIEQDLVIALLADSFGVGIVPFERNFATVAERALQRELSTQYDRIAVHNFGIPSVGMREYLHVLDQALMYNPCRVVLCVFVGNDIEGIRRPSRRDRFLIQDWLWFRYVDRFAAVYGNLRGEGKGLADLVEYVKMKGLGIREEVPESDAGSAPPDHRFLDDWTLEKPLMSRYAFLRCEQEAVVLCDTLSAAGQGRYTRFEKALDVFQARLGDRLVVLLIPDVFQVDDALWEELVRLSERPRALARDYPQRRIAAYCASQGIEVVDPLPELRAAQQDGRTYHLNDTHWNSRGNRIAGQLLGRRLVKLAESSESGCPDTVPRTP